jgi:DNA topoisomerase-1
VRLCPVCGEGKLSLKLGRFGAFIGCSNYPNCRYTRALGIESESDAKAPAAPDTELGTDPVTRLPVSLKKGPYGHYIQLGAGENGDKPKRAALPRGMEPGSVTFDIAIKLLALPREVGRHPDTGETITAGIGRFGAYLKLGNNFASLGADDDVLNIGLNRAVTVLAEAQNKAGGRRGPQLLRELGMHPDGGTVGLYRGRYGPYVSHDGLIASLPRAADPDRFSLAEALPLLAAQKAKGKTARKPRAAAPAAATNGARRTAKKPARKAAGRAKASPTKSRRTSSSRPANP